MLLNYFTTALRSLRRNLTYSLLNVLGLSIGMAACFIIVLVARHELGYDNFHPKADRTYRVTLNALDFNANVSLVVAPALRNDFPQLEHVTQVMYQNGGLVKVGEGRYNEKGFAFADAEFFKVFKHEWLAGDAGTALSEPNTVVLTESMAKKYFGGEWDRNRDVLGKTIRLFNQYDLKVSGVIEDVPGNTHLPFIFLVSLETIRKQITEARNFWNIPGGSYVYAVLPEGMIKAEIERQIPAFLSRNWGSSVNPKECRLPFQPMRDIHFDQRYINNLDNASARETYWALLGIAAFIIITASINFVNLATAQAMKRSKEVGVRKVLGANRKQLIVQFLGETTLLVLLSLFISLLLTYTFLPQAVTWLDIRLSTDQLGQPSVVAVMVSITLLVIVLAGFYPALVQSAFRPVESLKNQLSRTSFRGLSLRKALVVVQFAISQVLILGTLVVARQMDYFLNGQLGFRKDAVVSFFIPNGEKREVLKAQLGRIPSVREMSFSTGAPALAGGATSFTAPDLGVVKDDVTGYIMADEAYMDMFGLQLLAGEKITRRSAKDSVYRVLVNETMIHKLGIQQPALAIGKNIFLGGARAQIIGVVKDFQVGSRHKKLRPCILLYDSGNFYITSVRIETRGMRETLSRIDKVWSTLFPESLFEYTFLDEQIADMYRQEQKVYTAFRIFSAVAILIGCLGLYGLIAFTVVQRTKEIGIRKVLGASAASVVALLSKDFLRLVLLANLIAWPLAWWAMNSWLNNFAYRIEIGWVVFAVSTLSALCITLLTVSHQAVKAALANPVKSLRTE